MNPLQIRLPNGLTVFGLSKPDTDIVYQEIFVDDVYRRHGITIKDGDCIIDIGANTGLFVVFVNQICQAARLLAVEPVPAIFAALRRNVAQHDRLGTQLFNLGLSRQAGQATFAYYPRLSCASTMYPDNSAEEAVRGRDYVLEQFGKLSWPLRWPLALCPGPLRMFIANRVRNFYRKQETVTCPVQTLSDLIQEQGIDRIDLLKMDAERSEQDILAGITEADWLKIRQAVIEIHEGEAALRAVSAMLQGRGFTIAVDRNEPFHNIFMVYARR